MDRKNTGQKTWSAVLFRKTYISPCEENESISITVCTSGMGFLKALDFQQTICIVRAEAFHKATTTLGCCFSPFSYLWICRPRSSWHFSILSHCLWLLFSLYRFFLTIIQNKVIVPHFLHLIFFYRNISCIVCTEFLKQGEGIGIFCW